MKVRITYRMETYIEGENLDEIREKWEGANLIPNDEDLLYSEYVEIDDAVDANTLKPVNLY